MADDDFYAEDEEPVCQIYSTEDAFTSFVQAMLAAFALASLWIKRLQEKPQRKFLTWFLDVSKQAFGACYAHVLNMIISAVIAGNVRGGQTLDDECAWYAINYVIDTTLGLVITIVFLDWLERLANRFHWTALKNSGVYVGREGICHWVWQMIAWVVILTLVKVIICVFMWVFSSPLAYIGGVLFAPLQSNIRFELLFVMIFFPGVLNIIYFWITDSYLKAGKEHAGAHHDEEKAVPPSNVGESVTPYSQMGEAGEGVNTGKSSLSKADVTSYGSTPAGQKSGTLV
mmetsp:Transcript_18976/g.40660  ORF Transcript_18976/g.40660 Transcript_18976/m.40660 type:complete len:286 (+) Transcript_18976:262-1119(+)|eukprot:CAMPEP_0172552130 /NCGR_PEP_ID=MMETSP1067-20121228/43644_1 /TAXON_ID=265564 ORGANISM="Thalassiosira punctigera, Strain Tpunct2005C2" /NCGR_SAMPLE_ID=MMETSP1067 /ASSEMBLY_ACC=CAM_ASM_000444 /LENGTH=285 /DNA_ID=CAMNT_0013340051 /DNA_START=262 /DNA_END=1119 /DNA_ORIENTATION=+